MSNDLEFHYVISYREGFGWTHASDVENAIMEDGTIYDWDYDGDRVGGWFAAYEDSDDPENSAIAAIDTEHFRVLQSMLQRMNGE